MAVILLIFFIVICLILFFQLGNDIRVILLKGFLVTFFLVFFSTEVLSLINRISYRAILYSWFFLTFLAALFLIASWNRKPKEDQHSTKIKYR